MSIDLTNVSTFQDAVVTVMGLGRFKNGSGIGAAKWLMRHGAQIVITDLKSHDELKDSVDEIMNWYEKYKAQYSNRDIYSPVFVLGEHRADDFTDVDLVMQNPGVPRESEFVQLAKQHNVSVESDMSLFFRLCPFPIYAITGTRGKSTTTALLGEIFKQVQPKTVVAGNIQRSPLEDLDWLLEEEKPVPVVLEMSSWLIDSLENVARAPDIGIFTNIYADHLNRYASFEAYRESKAAMFYKQSAEQSGVFNFDQEEIKIVGEKSPGKKFWFSKNKLADGLNGTYVVEGNLIFHSAGTEEIIIPVSEIKLQGEHNLANALAAVTLAKLAAVTNENIASGLREFGGLPGRQEVIRELNGITYVNDTTATSPDGTIAALDRFGQKKNVILLAGGATKGLPLETLGEAIKTTCKFSILFEGTATEEFVAIIGEEVPVVRVDSMKAALEAATEVAKEGDVVLLSPGTASFGIFKNEFDRGDQFVAAVKKLK
ncbi:MAG: UDP-N-acetylmuramoylalanine-D-glutamate ligase [Candidatus Uhrbacteria bacterium GW2011_GWE2_45_35]|uniref:UDP-N-acetylmuramoylalanine--D-glutamate ligase n=1 Tax=Candidatus Uhrbacteria bacterium GW2011_GWE2_45_35 TaxID=1618993 RepID=A0A0G1MGR2_9BACT|nr:MAG: UDP-N-acetylmuramoylalanine-D-glutamate ligase [Candidatus Uhrbacteria bacterium GW2011_GWE2_45_35]HBR80147.1 UDP-N-acetylmuramoyl-L-alanine--D-glutamate ligase [Candidatus Uhrbacteria bacterium]HCU31336.1 UDP-N-acetylmuramoyl-L-alanine--D-glutamate ligase [Candidatus Uhrbacteria bacterium]